MNPKTNQPVEHTSDREIVISRLFDAPRELVWEAMTDPLQVVKWWGPRGFTTTIEEMDVRPGGVWKHVMHGPDGTDYPNKSIFKEIVKPERIVFSHGGAKEGGPGANFVATWTFETEGNQTRVTICMVFASADARNQVIKAYGAIEGGKQTLARLAEHLPEMAKQKSGALPSDRDFVVARVFSAPRGFVWRAWTEPKHMAQWWGPHHFTNPICELDVRPGGAYRIVMRSPEGGEFPAKGVYREVSPPERLVMTIDHSDLSEEWHDMVNPNRDKSAGKPALEAVFTVTFDELDGKTKLTIRTRFESAAILKAMMKCGMNEGWSQSLERLAECVAKMA